MKRFSSYKEKNIIKDEKDNPRSRMVEGKKVMNNFTQITISNRNFFAFKFFQLHKFVVEKAGKFEQYGQLETSCF